MKISKRLLSIIDNSKNEAYHHLTQSRNLKSYHREFTDKNFADSNRPLFILANVTGYFFQFFSAITAAALVYYFAYDITQTVYLSTLTTTMFLLLLEAAKRFISSRFFIQFVKSVGKDRFNYPLLSVIVLLASFSLCLSYFGAQRIVKESIATPILLKANTQDLSVQIRNIDKSIKKAEKTTWKGRITGNAMKAINKLNDQKAVLQNRILELEKATEKENKYIITNTAVETNNKAHYFAATTLLFELLFLLCCYYSKFYKFRSIVDLELFNIQPAPVGTKTNADSIGIISSKTDITPSSSKDNYSHTPAILEAIKELKRISKAKHKKNKSKKPNYRRIGFNVGGDENRSASEKDTSRRDENRSTTIKVVNIENSKVCKCCEKQFVYNHKKQIYCSNKCRKIAWKNKKYIGIEK